MHHQLINNQRGFRAGWWAGLGWFALGSHLTLLSRERSPSRLWCSKYAPGTKSLAVGADRHYQKRPSLSDVRRRVYNYMPVLCCAFPVKPQSAPGFQGKGPGDANASKLSRQSIIGFIGRGVQPGPPDKSEVTNQRSPVCWCYTCSMDTSDAPLGPFADVE